MEKIFTCEKLTATYEKNPSVILENFSISFDYHTTECLHIKIDQKDIRKIEIIGDNEISIFDLIAILLRLEKLLMLFDGYFLKIKNFTLSKSKDFTDNQLEKCAENLILQRLPYYDIDDMFKKTFYNLINPKDFISEEIFIKWNEFLESLGTVNQMFLYAISGNKLPVDIKCAFLIELSESLVEIIKENSNYELLCKLEKKMNLHDDIDFLIKTYGKEIFKKEYESNNRNNYEYFLRAMVNSRVNIMHIKRNQKSPRFDGNHCLLYMQKMYLLYRKILLDVLINNPRLYKNNLLRAVKILDDWSSDWFFGNLDCRI